MATLKRAFNGQSLPGLVLKILRGKYPQLPARYSGSLKGLVDCMLKLKPQVRCHINICLGFPLAHLSQPGWQAKDVNPLFLTPHATPVPRLWLCKHHSMHAAGGRHLQA